MSTSANYAASPIIGAGTTITADTSYTQPTAGTVGVIYTAPSTGARIDNIVNITLGTSVAGLLRLWLCEGVVGETVSSITFSTTTATVTTSASHGLSTGALIAMQGCRPNEYNVKSAAITVTGLTTFTYTMAATPSINATTKGEYSATPVTPIYHLFKELPITAVTGSTTIAANVKPLSSATTNDLPIVLMPAWSLRTTVTVTQTSALKTIARGGEF